MQLHVLRHEFWRLPIHVERIEDSPCYRANIPDIPLLRLQREVMHKRLGQIAQRMGDNEWLFEGESLLKNTDPTMQQDPEEVVVWNRTGFSQELSDRAKTQNEGFLVLLVKAGIFKSLPEARVMWNLFAKAILTYMVNERQPVDLLVCTLYPVPYRENWKEIIRRKLRDVKASAFFERQQFISPEIADVKVQTISGAYYGRMWLRWSLEVVPSKWFGDNFELREQRRRTVLRREYEQDIVDTLMAHKDMGVKLYARYLEKIRAPFPLLRDRVYTFRRGPKSRVLKKYVVPPEEEPLPPEDSDEQRHGAQGVQDTSWPQVESMFQMPDFQPDEPDVWDAQCGGVSKADWRTSSVRLPLPNGSGCPGVE